MIDARRSEMQRDPFTRSAISSSSSSAPSRVTNVQLSRQRFEGRPGGMFGFPFCATFASQSIVHPVYTISPCSSPDSGPSYDILHLRHHHPLLLESCSTIIISFAGATHRDKRGYDKRNDGGILIRSLLRIPPLQIESYPVGTESCRTTTHRREDCVRRTEKRVTCDMIDRGDSLRASVHCALSITID